MAKTKKILKQMMIFSFSAILIMGTGISVSADSSVEENIPDDMIQQIEQCQEETDFFSSNSEVGNFSSGSTDSNDDNNNSGDNNNGGDNNDNSSDSNNNNGNDTNGDNKDDNKNGDSDTSFDINNLPDGIYSVSGTMLKTDKKTASMADQAFQHTIKLTVKDGIYSLALDFRAMDMNGQMRYLGNIKYYKTGYTLDSNGNPQGEIEDTEVNSLQRYTNDTVVSDYFGTNYPDIVTFPMIEEARTDSYVPLQVFIPIMDAIAKGTGTQNIFLKIDWSVLKETSDDDDAFKDDSSNGAGGGNSNGNNSGNNNGNNNGSNTGNNSGGNGNGSTGNGSSNNGNSNINGGNKNNAGNNNNANNSGSGTNNSGYVNNAGLGGNSSLKKNNSSTSGNGSSLSGNNSLNGNSSLSGNKSLKSSGTSETNISKTSGTLSSGSMENSTMNESDGQEEMALNTSGEMLNSEGMGMGTSAVSQMNTGSQTEQSTESAWELSMQQSSAKKAGAMIPVWISAAAAVCGLGYKVKTGTNPKRRKKR